MSLVGRILGGVLRPIIERQVGRRSLGDLAERLERSARDLGVRFARYPDTPRNRETLNHIVGIERWGQRRLRVAQGEPFVSDSYRGYRLPEGASLDALRSAFAETRRETIRRARELAAAESNPAGRIRHNDLGELSLRGWLVYLDGHAKRESLRLRR